MSTWSVRCRHFACRMRRVSRVNPIADDSKCPSCGSTKGWRIEQRTYNKRNLCHCSGPLGRDGAQFPHNTTHPECDQHQSGFYNQAKRRGVTDDDIPLAHMPAKAMRETDDCPF